MKYPLIIGSHPGSQFLANCLKSLRGMECMVIVNDGYEMAKIREVYFNTRFEEFVFLQDSVELKHTHWIEDLFTEFPGRSVSVCGCPCPFGSYLGKFRREVLSKIALNETKTKVEAVNAERTFSQDYCAIEKPFQFFDDLNDRPVFEVMGGRQNMILENFFLKKYKGTWTMDMANQIDASK